jgi:hypothetical protein
MIHDAGEEITPAVKTGTIIISCSSFCLSQSLAVNTQSLLNSNMDGDGRALDGKESQKQSPAHTSEC